MYVGYDKPRSLGGWVQGGNTAAPIFKEFVEHTRDRWSDEPFVAPAGVRMVRIDRRSGKRVFDAWPTDDPLAPVIWEAFKPDTEPPRATRQDEIAAKRNEILELIRRATTAPTHAGPSATSKAEADTSFIEEQGGIY
jgi:penicillin-binding protein 1A